MTYLLQVHYYVDMHNMALISWQINGILLVKLMDICTDVDEF